MNTNEMSSAKTAESADIASQFLKEKGFIIIDQSIDREMIPTQTLNLYEFTNLLIQYIFFALPSPTLGLD